MKLNVKAFSLSCGLFFGAGLFLITWWIIAFGGPTNQSTFIDRIYLGYSITPIGSFIGFAWAFIDGFIFGAFFAWLYNWLILKFPSKKES